MVQPLVSDDAVLLGLSERLAYYHLSEICSVTLWNANKHANKCAAY